jgi:hypothetical protein
MDIEEKVANIFWTDAKIIADYTHFGDVISFDTTFRTNRESHDIDCAPSTHNAECYQTLAQTREG